MSYRAKVEVYGTSFCRHCVAARALLERKQVDYTEYLLDLMPLERDEMIRRCGVKKVPQIFINDEWIGGFDDMIRFDKNGELNWRLGLEPKPKVSFTTRVLRYLSGHKY